jgi:dTDP-4-dehydrorhamnose 3,5-epimerase-like enzyme
VGLDEVANCNPITLQHVEGGARGSLTVAEYGGAIPFDFRRVYYMTGVTEPGAVRGRHAHKTLQQALFCINGSVRLDVDDGTHKASIVLDQPHEGVYIGPLLWHELRDFSPGAVVLVFAAAEYDESDYLRDYDAFLAYVQEHPVVS